MSEKAPQPTPFDEAIDNFDENMGKEWIKRLKGNAGETDFSADDKARLNEAREYYRHMEGLDGKDRGEEIYNEHEAAFGNEWEGAIADDEAFNKAREDALEEKFANSPSLRRMKNISQEIADIRDTKVTASNDKDLQERLKKREDALQELLVAYEASDDFDQSIADMLMDPADDALRNTAANKALHEQGEPASADKAEKGKVDENDPASQALDLISAWNDAESRKGIKEDPEKLKAISEELAKLQKELDEAAKAADETNKKAKTLKNWGGGISALRDPKETREDEEAHHFVKDREDAHEQAIPINAEFDADVAAKEAEADKTRVHDKNEAWAEALLEQDRRDLPEDWDEALVEQEERRLRDWDAAIEEDKWRNRFQPTPAPQRRRFERTRSRLEKMFGTPTKKALGVLALAAATGALGWALSPDKAADSHVDSGTNATATPDKPSETKTPVNAEAKPKTAHEKLLESPAWNIPNGGGGEQMMNRLHVDKGVWYANEAEFLKEHPDEAYRMSDGHVGFSDPGKLSMNSIKFWADKVEHQNQK